MARRTSAVWPRMRSSSRRRRPVRPAAKSSDRWRAMMTSLPAVTQMDQSISGVGRGGPCPSIPETLGCWGTEDQELTKLEGIRMSVSDCPSQSVPVRPNPSLSQTNYLNSNRIKLGILHFCCWLQHQI